MANDLIAWLLMFLQALIASTGVTVAVMNYLDAHEDVLITKTEHSLERYVAEANLQREVYVIVAIVCLFIVSVSVVSFAIVPDTATLRMLVTRFCLLIATVSLTARGIHVLRHRHKLLRNTWRREGQRTEPT